MYESPDDELYNGTDEDEDPPPPPEPSSSEQRAARKRALGQLAVAIGAFLAARPALDLLGVYAWIERRAPRYEIPAHIFIQGVIALALVWGILRVSRESWRSVGASKPQSPWLEVGRGAALVGGIYVIMMPLMLAAMLLIRGPAREQMALQKVEALSQKAQAVAVFGQIPLWVLVPSAVMAGVYEEVFVRGLIQSRLARLFAGARELRWVERYGAVLLSSALFGLMHWYQGPVGVMQTAVVGLILGIAAAQWRSIWAAAAAHVIIDTMGLLVSRLLVPAAQGLLQRS